MKVYVLTWHAAYNCEFLGVTNKVFLKKEDAVKEFEKLKKCEREIVEDNGWMIAPDHNELRFEAWEEGRYTTDHTEGYVTEQEVIE